MSGPLRILLIVVGGLGNMITIFIFTRPHMRKSEINYVLIGKLLNIKEVNNSLNLRKEGFRMEGTLDFDSLDIGTSF